MSANWCAGIKDATRINELAIPGTHDAAAWTHHWNWPGLKGTWAQRKNFTEQLDLGVRVLDLRVGWSWGFGRWVGMYHGPVYLDQTLEEVLEEIDTWLAAHAQEFVILIFQQQGKKPQSDATQEVHRLVSQTFGARLVNFAPILPLWPKVSEMRGKVLAMGRLNSDVAGFCNVRDWLTDGNNTPGAVIDAGAKLKIYLQDVYSGVSGGGWGSYVSKADDNNKKFAKVRAAAEARPNITSSSLLKINHMSYSNLRYQPWELGKDVNALLRNSNFKIQGALMIDDADQATVDHILANNARLLK